MTPNNAATMEQVFKLSREGEADFFCRSIIDLQCVLGEKAAYHEIGDKYSLEVVEMSTEEIDNLPEADG